MATYKYMTKDGQKVQVESAKRDGSGKNIENNYAKQTGYYSGMGVGSADLADNLTTTTGITDTTSFVFQSSGGQQDIATGYAELRALRGNSVAFIQPIPTNLWSTETKNDFTLTNNGDGSYTIDGTASANSYFGASINFIQGHKYLLKGCPANGGWGSPDKYMIDTSSGIGRDYGEGIIGVAIYGGTRYIGFYVGNGQTFTNYKIIPQLFDLTLMFGAGNEPTTVVEFNRLFPLPYYEYNAGELLSSKSNGYKIVGYNAWDEQWEQGIINNSTGQNELSSSNIRSKNYIRVISGQTYIWDAPINNGLCFYDANKNFITIGYFPARADVVIPNNCCFIRFYCGTAYGTTYNNDIAIHLKWSGSKTGYEPYYSFTYTMPNVELRSAGSAFDELKPDGTLIRRVGVVDLGTLNWTWVPGIQGWKATINDIKYVSSNQNVANAFCSKYKVRKASGLSDFEGNCLAVDTNDIKVQTTGQNNDSDKPTGTLYYELATPTTEQNDAYKYDELGRIDDYGTQEFISNQTIQVPQGAEFFYQKNLKDFLNRIGSRADIDFDPNNIVSKTELSAYLTTISGYDGTKTQVLKNINGVFTWVDEA